jgi:GDP-L-fucose synthase
MKIFITGGNGNISKMIKKHLSNEHEIVAPGRNELNVLNLSELENFLSKESYDILIHTAISGGRRTKEENGDVTHNNLLMLENILHFSDKFRMIINFDSGAIYDRASDILNRKEEELLSVPTDYYGFSKYLIYKRSLQHNNIYNLRIFNIFHVNEEPDRFIKTCFLSKKNNNPITIFEDKYFDFMYEDDFIKIVKFYIDNCNTQEKLEKTINICYEEKFKLSDIAKLIISSETTNINVIDCKMDKNYSGDCEKLNKLGLSMIGLKESLKIYEQLLLETLP